jgi:hypothetical protein
MPKSDSLFRIERNSRSIYLKDGLVDMMFGIFLILMAFWMINRYMIFHLIWLFVAQIIIEVIRRKIIYPRVGYAKFRHERLVPIMLILGSVAGIAVLSGIIAVIAGVFDLPLRHKTFHIFALATVVYVPIILSAFAYHHKAYRWVFYGILIAVLLFFGMILNSPLTRSLFIITGIIITAIGGIIFVKFLHTHQPQYKEVHDDRAV